MPTTYAIPDGRTVMDATLYTGDASYPRAITNAGAFQPDLVWVKARSAIHYHALFDSVRGTGTIALSTNTTSAETGISAYANLTSFNSNGFSCGTTTDTNILNDSGKTFVAWQWKAGGTTVSNTSGTITSSVSVNTTAGFSIVTYTGTGANATVGHALTAAPSMVIVKNRSSAVAWAAWHTSIANTQYLVLNTTAEVATGATWWNSTSPTSSVISVGTSTSTNASGNTYVAYCWTPIAGFSQFGSYTGNNSADGPFVYLGFRPKFVLFKRTESARNWIIFDTSRATYTNAVSKYLIPNDSLVEGDDLMVSGSWQADFLSNGFKLRAYNELSVNPSGGNIIYAAFAENPFKYSNAR